MKIDKTLEEQPAQKQVGRALNRLEARSKVTGRAEYIHNLVLPRTLYGNFSQHDGARKDCQYRHERRA